MQVNTNLRASISWMKISYLFPPAEAQNALPQSSMNNSPEGAIILGSGVGESESHASLKEILPSTEAHYGI